MKSRVHLFISGRVQGVFFRANTRNKAQQLNLKGWVKNLPDGRVEVIAEGDEKKVDELVEWCKEGSAGAKVTDIEMEKEEYRGEFTDFEIRY